MNILQIGILVFVLIETMNIVTLYFYPGSKKGNGIGVFNSFHRVQEQDKDFVYYLIYWVAGTKLIFIMLGVVIVVFGNYQTQLYTVLAFIISILSFYWKLYPIIRKLDNKGDISPTGYSKGLFLMILGMILGFLAVFVTALIY